MVLFTPKKLGSKKQHQILAQTAYYQAGKIVVQTILPEQPPVALITLNTLGTTCSTSADTYIPIENIFNTQSCSFLESRLISLYGGKAASLLIEYQQRLNPPYPKGVNVTLNKDLSGSYCAYPRRGMQSPKGNEKRSFCVNEMCGQTPKGLVSCKGLKSNRVNEGKTGSRAHTYTPPHVTVNKDLSGVKAYNTELINNITKCRTCFAGAGNNIFQSTLGNIEIQTATRLARIMVNYWNFYSLNKSSLYSIFKKDAPAHQLNALHSKTSINSINKLANFSLGDDPLSTRPVARKNPPASARVNFSAVVKVNSRAFANVNPFANTRVNHYLPQYLPLRGLQQRSVGSNKQLSYCAYPRRGMQSPLQVASPHTSFPDKSSDKSSDRSSSLNPPYPKGVNVTLNKDLSGSYCAYPRRGMQSPKGVSSATCKGSRSRLEDLSGVRGPSEPTHLIPIQIEDLSGVKKICTKSRRIPFQRSASTATICNRWQSKGELEELKGHKHKEHLLQQHEESVAKELEVEGYAKRKYNVRVWGIKLKVKDKTLAKRWGNIIYKVAKRRNNLYFAIAQSKNSLKTCESSGTSNSSYNIQRLSIENIGNYSQLNNNNFQLINSLQFSNLQRDRFYPNWFRLYLPDMEATEFLKNVANYYFSLGLQTFTFPSTKFSYYSTAHTLYTPFVTPHTQAKSSDKSDTNLRFVKSLNPEGVSSATCMGSATLPVVVERLSKEGVTLPRFDFGKLGVSTASPFLIFLNKNTEKFIPTIISYTYCPPSILVNFTSDKFSNSRITSTNRRFVRRFVSPTQTPSGLELNLLGVSPTHTSGECITCGAAERVGYPLNVPFSLLLENQIFPFNYNGFSVVEKELLYNALVNSSFAKAFYLINQNRQLLDFLVDYLLRFQILRQHQILYLFSTLLLGCNKTA